MDEDTYKRVGLTSTDILNKLNMRFCKFVENKINKEKLDQFLNSLPEYQETSKTKHIKNRK